MKVRGVNSTNIVTDSTKLKPNKGLVKTEDLDQNLPEAERPVSNVFTETSVSMRRNVVGDCAQVKQVHSESSLDKRITVASTWRAVAQSFTGLLDRCGFAVGGRQKCTAPDYSHVSRSGDDETQRHAVSKARRASNKRLIAYLTEKLLSLISHDGNREDINYKQKGQL